MAKYRRLFCLHCGGLKFTQVSDYVSIGAETAKVVKVYQCNNCGETQER